MENTLIKLTLHDETKKRAHDSQVVRAKENLKLNHGGSSYKALPGKLDIKSHSPSKLYIFIWSRMVFPHPCQGNRIAHERAYYVPHFEKAVRTLIFWRVSMSLSPTSFFRHTFLILHLCTPQSRVLKFHNDTLMKKKPTPILKICHCVVPAYSFRNSVSSTLPVFRFNISHSLL